MQEPNIEMDGPSAAESPPDPELVSLVQRASDGDREAVSNLYERFCDRIYRYVLFKVGDVQQAEDICAQVFLKMVESISRFRWRSDGSASDKANVAAFSSWLYRIAHNLITDDLRRQLRRPSVPLDYVAERLLDSQDPQQAAEAAFSRQQLVIALSQLTDLQAQVIAMKFGSRLSNAEVGQILGRSEGAVKALQYSALQKLHRLLSKIMDEG